MRRKTDMARGMRLDAMSERTEHLPWTGRDPVADYLEKRGVAVEELPPDMLRELTRLMEAGQIGTEASAPASLPVTNDTDPDLRRDLLTFEMYLAAWIASARICDRPKRPHT
jgi:hypothetical protein